MFFMEMMKDCLSDTFIIKAADEINVSGGSLHDLLGTNNYLAQTTNGNLYLTDNTSIYSLQMKVLHGQQYDWSTQ